MSEQRRDTKPNPTKIENYVQQARSRADASVAVSAGPRALWTRAHAAARRVRENACSRAARVVQALDGQVEVRIVVRGHEGRQADTRVGGGRRHTDACSG